MISARIGRPKLGIFREFERRSIQHIELAALIASDRGASIAHREVRTAMAGASLGRLGQAIGYGSDLKKGGRIHRFGANGFSASGWLYVRSRSERTIGAIEAYTSGADIRPKRGGWLWIATDNIPARVGRYRMTPGRYRASGLEERLGPLIQIPGRNAGEALLIIRNVTTRVAGRPNARPLPRSGRVRAGRQNNETLVAFVGIRRTSRQARVDIAAIVGRVQQLMPDLIAEALGRN